jgi:DNA-binding GntR family transcriptional regulator
MPGAAKTNGLRPVKTQVLRHDVADSIRNAIASGTLKPGQRVLEVELAEQLGVSRLPIREAVRQLEHEGLLISTPHRGTFVAEATEADIREMFSLRRALETLAARLVAERANPSEVKSLQKLVDEMRTASAKRDYGELFRIDTEFHTRLCTYAHHVRLLKHWNLVYGQWQALDSLMDELPTLKALPDGHPVIAGLNHFADTHQALVDAIRAGDGELAEQTMRRHMEEAEQSTLDIHAAGKTRG